MSATELGSGKTINCSEPVIHEYPQLGAKLQSRHSVCRRICKTLQFNVCL